MKMTACVVLVLLVYSIMLHTAEAWYGRDDSPELYDTDSSPEDQGYDYDGYRNYNGYGGYRFNGYGGNYDIDDVSIELGRHQLQSQRQKPCALAIMRNVRNKRMMTACTGLCDTSIAASTFPGNHLCIDCKTANDAARMMNMLLPILPAFNTPYLLFNDRTYGASTSDISFTDINSGSADKCSITHRVHVWSCKKKSATKPWTCAPQGFCKANIERASATADYLPKPPTCTCHNPLFEEKHVCPTCTDKADAKAFVTGKKPTANSPRDIFSGIARPFTYDEIPVGNLDICLIDIPREIMAWKCDARSHSTFGDCEDIGYCTNIRSLLTTGHLEYDDKICYKRHDDMKWVASTSSTTCTQLADIAAAITNAASCMIECKKNTAGCNAFNFKVGTKCILMKCPTPYPVPTPDTTDHYVAYYL